MTDESYWQRLKKWLGSERGFPFILWCGGCFVGLLLSEHSAYWPAGVCGLFLVGAIPPMFRGFNPEERQARGRGLVAASASGILLGIATVVDVWAGLLGLGAVALTVFVLQQDAHDDEQQTTDRRQQWLSESSG